MFDPDEFLKLAENLIKESPTEAEVRSSISRAYYGSFHLCKKWLESERGHGFQNSVGDHGLIQKYLKKEKGRHVKDKFSRARRNRNNADYDLNANIDVLAADSQLKLVNEVLNKCEIK